TLSNLRHFEAMKRLQEAIGQVRQGLEQGTPSDLVAIDLRDAIHNIGTITGEVTTDEILGTIFSRFCVGK
ncbi:MAG: tRNA uridine-5-carboxymethylaminomethyl(34) synthesis GTPase MnmE, partial [Bacteroidales bacterium]|nr:tRNA uridine-5-carboxymethylaminomethyl(34) synthesis GTPase MnmE [Bacteroidales bacterium]